MVAPMRETHFGYRDVPLADKQVLVDDVFHKVARRYDLMNDLMSGGLHRAWKDALVTAINPPTKGRPGRLGETKGRPGRLDEKPDRDFSLLDVAGGTGDVSFRTIQAGGAGTRAAVADAEPYRYLVESIRRFPRPNAFGEMMRAAGLRRVSQRLMSGGIVALHSGWRL